MGRDDLGVPETPAEVAWRSYTERGVVVASHRDEIRERKGLLREWAAVGCPLR